MTYLLIEMDSGTIPVFTNVGLVIAAPAGSIAGSASLAFAAAGSLGALSAPGALAGSVPLAFSTAGILKGRGALAGSSSLTFTATAEHDLGGYPSDLPAATVTLNNAYNYTSYNPSGQPDNTVIDAGASTWIMQVSKNDNPTAGNTCSVGSNSTNFYPIDIQSGGDDLWFYHGTVNGLVPMNSEWDYTYCGSGTSVRFQNCPGPGIAGHGPTISDYRADRVWDGIRSIYSNDWTIQRVHISNIRDDAIENDTQEGGTIKHSLFDGCLNFLACDPSSNPPQMPTQQHVEIDGVLVRLRLSLQQGDTTHGSFFKYSTTTSEKANNPTLTLNNCVFAFEDPNHNGFSRMAEAWTKATASGHSNNTLINLSATAMPGGYPFPPARCNFTIINQNGASQAAAISAWNAAKAAFLAANPHLDT